MSTASPDRTATGRARGWLLLLLLAYTAVTVAYGLVNPLFEAPDEHWHYFTAQYIADERALPAVAPGDNYDEWLSQEAAQPPLYYLLGSLLIAGVDAGTAREDVWPNKFADIGDAGALININRFVHSDQEAWPWQGYVLAAHLLRLFSTLLGLGTLLFIYASGRLLWPTEHLRPLLAVGLVAFLPQYNFLHASVSNDPLVIMLVAAALWQIVRLWLIGPSSGRLLLLGVTIGLAILSKNTGVTLLAYSSGVILLLVWRESLGARRIEWRTLGRSLALVIGPALLLGGWLWLRNWSLYGDFTATNQFIRLAGGDREYTLPLVLRESRGLWLSLFAVFGWFNLRPPAWVSWFWSGVALLGILGLVWGVWTTWAARWQPVPESVDHWGQRIALRLRESWVLPTLLGLWILAVYASLLFFMLQTEAAQGRLLFPAILPAALGLAYGLTAPPMLRRLSPILPPIALGITLYCLFFVIRPAYAPPPLMAELPLEATPLDIDMGQGVRLVGVDLETEAVLPGEPVWLTLYWQGNDVTADTPEHVLSIFGRDGVEIGKLHSYHGRGLFPATLWPEHRIVADRFAVRVSEDTLAPVQAHVDSALLRGEGSVRVAEVKVNPPDWPLPIDPPLGQLGSAIGFAGVKIAPAQVQPGQEVTIAMQWQALQAPEQDYTALVHLGQPDQAPLATGDRPPLRGDYPTSAWAAGEMIDDTFVLQIPADIGPGRYPIWLGMYDSQTLTRLPVILQGETQPYNVYLAGWVEIIE